MTQAMRQITSATTTGTPAAPAKAVCRAKHSDAVVEAMPDFMRIGAQLAIDVINDRSYSRLAQYVADSNSEDEYKVARGMNVMYGFTRLLVATMVQAVDNGQVRFNGVMPYRVDDVDYAFKTGRGRFLSLYNAATKTMSRVLAVTPSFKVSLPSKSEEAAPAPTPIRIVGMPTRATTTDIERNGAGEIVSSLQVEKDF